MEAQVVDVEFVVTGTRLPVDHGYALFGALCRVLPQLHERRSWAVLPVHGGHAADRLLHVGPRSRITLRLPLENIPEVVPLAGRELDVDGHRLKIGAPTIKVLRPAPMLKAHIVLIANSLDPRAAESEQRVSFRDAVEAQVLALAEGGSKPTVEVGRRHVMRIGPLRPKVRGGVRVEDRDVVVGFGVTVSGLSDETSLVLEEKGVGGRRHMGAGVFVPLRRRA